MLVQIYYSYFYKTVCIPLVQYYRKCNPSGTDPVIQHTSLLGSDTKLTLDKIWVNYQFKNEFNPYHDHSGVYSFAIWMKIPYSSKEQHKLPQFLDIKEGDRKPGNFDFEYIDPLGQVTYFTYQLSPELEGVMLFFPAKLRHCVYPFYKSDEPRISIAGNLSYLPG